MESNAVARNFFSGANGKLERLDAEFAQPSLLNEEAQIVKRLEGTRICICEREYDGPTVSDSFKDEDETVRYIAIDGIDTDDGFAYSDDIRYGDRPSRAKYVVKNGDILVSNVRPNRGAVTLISKRNEGVLASSGFSLLRRFDKNYSFSQEYLFAFLKTRFARTQLIRRNRGSMYPAVLGRDVGDVYVPFPPKSLHSSIVGMIQRAEALHNKFDFLRRSQVEKLTNYLVSLVTAPPSPLEGPTTGISFSIRRSSEFSGEKGTRRFDAEFFRNEYEECDKALQKAGATFILGKYYSASSGRAPGKEEEEIPYIKQASLTNVGINWSAVELVAGHHLPARGRVKADDILMACTAHEVYYVARKVDYVRDVPSDYRTTNVAVADILILKPRQEKPSYIPGSYVAAFLRSPWGLHQVQRCIRGLRGGHVYGIDVEKFIRVPIPEPAWLKEFEEISAEMEKARIKSKETVFEARSLLENWLEVQLR